MDGEVAVGVQPALPIEGAHFILGNGLAGSKVWSDAPPSPVVTSSPCESVASCELLPEVLSSCTVTRATAKKDENFQDDSGSDIFWRSSPC